MYVLIQTEGHTYTLQLIIFYVYHSLSSHCTVYWYTVTLLYVPRTVQYCPGTVCIYSVFIYEYCHKPFFLYYECGGVDIAMSRRVDCVHLHMGTLHPVSLDNMATSTSNARRYGSVLNEYFLFILLGFGVVTLWMSSIHEGVTNPIESFQSQHFSSAGLASERQPPENDAGKERKSLKKQVGKARNGEQADLKNKERDTPEERVPVKDEPNKQDNESHKLAGLDCSMHGGPPNDIAAEMVYWSDIPSDNAHVSPFYSPENFLTFEPDNGGWNNIRMSMETVLAMAVAMGRTLVLPPEQGMYLLGKEEGIVSLVLLNPMRRARLFLRSPC